MDIYYRRAKEEGYRVRSAYKLLQIDDKYNIFEGVQRVIDLCSAPGSWSQVVSKRPMEKGIKGTESDIRVISVDLQEMAPISGVHIMQGDITTKDTVDKMMEKFGGQKAELVICDGAPDSILAL